MTARPLSRAAVGAGTPPVRIIHLGLGAFHRAHQAWYTAKAPDAGEWGIAAFTGRSPQVARTLAAQEGLYTLITRSRDADTVEVLPSIVAAHSGDDLAAARAYAARPEVAVITLTVTEAGYRLTSQGDPDPDDAQLAADHLEMAARGPSAASPVTAIGRLVAMLAARREAGAGPIALVPCDNVPHNGPWLARGVDAVATSVDQGLAEWIGANVSFVSTSVDRITPRTTDADLEVARAAGWLDNAPVVTEPFADWVLSGDFPAGRPDWGSAGAHFVGDIAPFERRKLWLLNGAHTLMAAAGRVRGLDTVASAAADPQIWALVNEYWAEALRHLDDRDHSEYLRSLRERFDNPRIVHSLAQIATDSSTKLRVREVAVARLELAAGRSAGACAAAIGAWIASLSLPNEVQDSNAEPIAVALAEADPVRALVSLLDEDLGHNPEFVALVRKSLTDPQR